MAKLSAAQVRALKTLSTDFAIGLPSITTSYVGPLKTLRALRDRNLVKAVAYSVAALDVIWEITDAGCAALAEAEATKTDE